MALSASTIWEVQTGGDDTNNSGAFDPSQTAGMFSDGAASSSTSATPTFSSASYNFTSTDVGAWIYIASGSTYIAGWYKITAVGSNVATLDAAIGHGVLKTTLVPTTVQGVGATAASAVWTIDYSQGANSGAGPKFTYTDLSSTGAGLTVSSAAHPFGKQYVGNSLVITGGTNFNTGRFVIASVAAGVATVVGPTNIHSTAGTNSDGAGSMGGALASLGQAGAAAVASNIFAVKSGTYTISSATANISGGCFSGPSSGWLFGYSTARGDLGSPPLLQASGISTATLITTANNQSQTQNIKVDGAGLTSIKGFSLGRGFHMNLGALNCTNTGIASSNSNAIVVNSYATGCSAQAAIVVQYAYWCESYSNTISGFSLTSGSVYVHCLSYGNSGSSSDGFLSNGNNISMTNCVAYNNGRHGFNLASDVTNNLLNCIAESNGSSGTGTGIRTTVATSNILNCAVYGNVTNTAFSTVSPQGLILNLITGTSSFFVNAVGGNFALNNTSGAGASLRAAGFPGTFPAGTSTGYLDIGAVQARWPVMPMGIQGVV